MNNSDRREILDNLRQQGMLEYGSVFHQADLLRMFEIIPISEAEAQNLSLLEIRKRIANDALKELSVVEFIRSVLIKEGKAFEKERDQYRIPLPSENIRVIAKLQDAAIKKIRRAKSLMANSPSEVRDQGDAIASRVLIAERASKRKHVLQ